MFKLDTLLLKQKKLPVLDIASFFVCIHTQGKGLVNWCHDSFTDLDWLKVLNHPFNRSCSRLGSVDFFYINESYIWKSEFSWDLILNVFNSKTATSSDKCTWFIIIPGGAKTARHYIFVFVFIHQHGASFFPVFPEAPQPCLESTRNTDLSLWLELTRAWTYDGPHSRWSC